MRPLHVKRKIGSNATVLIKKRKELDYDKENIVAEEVAENK